jgi:hypothetical protein
MTHRTSAGVTGIVLGLGLTGAAGRGGAADATAIPEKDYVTVRDGHLHCRGKRVRYWGLVCAIAGDPRVKPSDSAEARQQKVGRNRRAVDVFVKRLGDMGFNLIRTWEGRYPHQRDELPLLHSHDYEPGDGSSADAIAYSWHKLDQAGIKLWMSSTNGVGAIRPEDVDVIEDPATAAEWKEAVAELTKTNGGEPMELRRSGRMLLPAVDERVEALWISRLRLLADFPNRYKGGLRLGDDPQVVVWELTNEHFPYRHFFYGHWKDLPAYFRKKLLGKWAAFLKRKYGTDAKLREAWGFLLPGESLAKATVMLLPLARPMKGDPVLSDANPAITESLKAREAGYARGDFTRRRGADVIAFANELIISHKQRLEKALETMGRSCRLSPTVYDSGNSFRVQSAYMHQFADAVSTCSYTKGMGHDPRAKRFPFFSQLDDAPRTSWGVPWFEQSTALGKPHFVYETNIDNRTKYRAEYPLRVAALASIQDWDIVCWHTYPGRDKQLNRPDKPFDRKVHAGFDYFTIRGDEIYIAALRAGGEIFRNRLVPPAPDPVVFTFGRKSLLDPRSMDYGKSFGEYADHFIGTTYRYGSRVVVDPRRDDDSVGDRHTVRPNVFQSNPVKPNDAITYDWQRGLLTMDSPGAASYTGFFGEYGSKSIAFDHSDVVFGDIRFANPEGIAYPVKEEEGYCTITLASTDGEPLAKCRKAVLVPVSTSFNTGFQLDVTRSNQGRQTAGPKDCPPMEHWGAWLESGGKEPVLVVRVGVTVTSQSIDGMRYTFRDWYMNDIGHGKVAGGKLTVPADREVWIVELER